MVKRQAYEDLTGEGRLLDEGGDWRRYSLRVYGGCDRVGSWCDGVMVLVAGVVVVGGGFGGGCGGVGGDTSPIPPEFPTSQKKHRFSELRGETNRSSIEALVKGTGKESLQWGLAAGMYSGLTYGLREARGVHDWKNSAMAGAITGAALALTFDDSSHEDIVQGAITGAAISTAANLLTGIF
ncbi:hypothetical protein Tco_1300105 [Tanacetum coccineum]